MIMVSTFELLNELCHHLLKYKFTQTLSFYKFYHNGSQKEVCVENFVWDHVNYNLVDIGVAEQMLLPFLINLPNFYKKSEYN